MSVVGSLLALCYSWEGHVRDLAPSPGRLTIVISEFNNEIDLQYKRYPPY